MTRMAYLSSHICRDRHRQFGHCRHRAQRGRYPRFSQAITDARLAIGAPTLWEARLVLAKRNVRDPSRATVAILAMSRHEVVPFDHDLSDRALAAFLAYGKGRHPAKLNFGDCMAYAVAKALDAPLLYKGKDFARTDIRSAL